MRRLLLVLVIATPLFAAQADAPAALTQVESLRIENVRLEGAIIQREIADWTAKRTALKADLEKDRLGWIFDLETGKFQKAPK